MNRNSRWGIQFCDLFIRLSIKTQRILSRMACDRSVDPISPSQLINSNTNLLAQLYLRHCWCFVFVSALSTVNLGDWESVQVKDAAGANSRVHSCCAFSQINGHNKMIIVLASIEYWFDANNNSGRIESRGRAARPIKDKCNIFFSVRQKPSWIVSKVTSQAWQWGRQREREQSANAAQAIFQFKQFVPGTRAAK